MERLEIDNILEIEELISELEFEKATSILGKLRWMEEEDKSLKPVRQHLLSLIQSYESKHWSSESTITDDQIKESDIADRIVNAENIFVQRRKEIIRGKLKDLGLAQKDLAKILGHRPNYMSELINGIRPLSRDDIVVIHRFFEIEFKNLIPPFLKKETTKHIKSALLGINSDKVKRRMREIETV